MPQGTDRLSLGAALHLTGALAAALSGGGDGVGPVQAGVPISILITGALSCAFFVVVLAIFWLRSRAAFERAHRNRILFDENPEPIVLTDSRWKVIEANHAACALFGYSQDQVNRITLNGLIETKVNLDPAAIKDALHAGENISFEARYTRDGNDPVELAATTHKITLGGKACWLTALYDLTQQKQDQRILKLFHRRLVEDLPIEVVVLGPQGQYLYANPKAIPDDELRAGMIGETDVEFCQYMGYHPEIALGRRSHRRNAISTRKASIYEETLTQKDGSNRSYTRVYNPVFDKDGIVTAVIVYGVDMTELKRYQDEIVSVRTEAERVAELKEAFLANISHEFRTPLTGILGFAQLLQEDVGPDEREFVDIILRNGRRLMATLNAMIDLSKLHSNYLEMAPQVVNLVDEVKEVAQSVSGMAQEKQLFLRLRATRPEVLVRLDRSHLYRVLENLIGNAIKFTHTGGVIVEVSNDFENAYVHVMDTGVGIRNEFLPFLFEEFNQESSGLSRNFEGTGIGLAVVKRLLDMMGGSISVDSEKGEGSTFTLIFPAAFPQTRAGSPNRSRVLVADESEEVHTLIQYVLSPYFDVAYASDFATLMQRAQEKEFDVVLVDPEISEAATAAETLAPLRDLRGYDRVPVIALDPHPVRGSEVHFLSAGYDDCLQKPLDKQILLNSLGQVLTGDRKPMARAQAKRRQRQA